VPQRDPNPFTSAAALADFDQDMRRVGEMLDRLVGAMRDHTAKDGVSNAMVDTLLAVRMMPAATSTSLLVVAIRRLADCERCSG
jgi:hypothetical protein